MSHFVVAREDAFDFRSTEYAALYDRSDATLFQHPTWLDALYHVRVPATGTTPIVVTVRESTSGRLVGLLPLVLRRRWGIRFVEFADLGVTDYISPVIDRNDLESVLTDELVTGGIQRSLGRFDVLQAQKVRGPTAAMARLLSATTMRRLRYDAHAVALPPVTEPWREKLLDPSFARRLAKARKRLRPKGEFAFRQVTEFEEVDRILEQLRDFRAARFADRRAIDLMQDPGAYSFYRSLARASIANGGPGCLYVITVAGEPVAASLDLTDEHEHVHLIVGYDFARLRNYSLGLVIVEELIDHATASGLHTFDLTVGNEGYKADFGGTPVPMYVVRVTGTLRGRLAALVMDLAAHARRVAKRATLPPVMRSRVARGGHSR